MPDETTGAPGGGPPSFPGSAPRVPPPSPPPAPPTAPPPAPPSYPSAPSGGYPPPPPGRFPSSFPGAGYDNSQVVPYARWGTRLGGYLIDVVIFIPVLVVLYIAFRHTHALEVHLMVRRNGGHTRRSLSLLSPVITAVAFVVYATILCGGARGQTVGMMAVGVRVVRDEAHDVLGYGRAFWRAFVEQFLRILGTVTLILGVLWLLDMLFPLWDSKKQTLHDKIVKTVVISVRPTG
ncbi:MAG: RDD family protein [Acidimicrobiales bacterium]